MFMVSLASLVLGIYIILVHVCYLNETNYFPKEIVNCRKRFKSLAVQTNVNARSLVGLIV